MTMGSGLHAALIMGLKTILDDVRNQWCGYDETARE